MSVGNEEIKGEALFTVLAEALGLSITTTKYTLSIDKWDLSDSRTGKVGFTGTYEEACDFIREACYGANRENERMRKALTDIQQIIIKVMP